MKQTAEPRHLKIADYINDIIKLNQEGEFDYMETRITKSEYRQIIQALVIFDRLQKERRLWEEPMDSSFSNEIRRSVIRTLDEISNISTFQSRSNAE